MKKCENCMFNKDPGRCPKYDFRGWANKRGKKITPYEIQEAKEKGFCTSWYPSTIQEY